jgi:hypothetical protein
VTCRRKCRKCDRTKPECKRCISQGLVCEGYPLNIKMYGVEGGSLRKSRPSNAPTTVTTRQASKAAPRLEVASEVVPVLYKVAIAPPDEGTSTLGSSWATEPHVPAEHSADLLLSTSDLKLRDHEDIRSLLHYCTYSIPTHLGEW